MKTITALLITLLMLVGCSASSENDKNIVPKLVVGKSLTNIQFKDQFAKQHTISPDTYKIVFAFSKKSGHTCNDFFKTQKVTYLQDHHTAFIADISAAPSLIRSMFILPGLKDLKHTVLLLDSKELAAPYRKGMDTEKIGIVYIINGKIQEIKEISTAQELQKALEADSPMDFIAPVINKTMNTLNELAE